MEVSQVRTDLETGVEESLSNMGLADREMMIRKLQAVLDRQYMLMMQASLDNCTCPRCGQEEYSKYGFDKNRRQRYKCMSCGMIYTAASHANLLSLSKLDIEVWKKYCECFVDGLSLRKSAEKCEVGLKTSLYMRRCILELIHSHLPSFEINPGSGVELDETFFRESFKGNHKNSTTILPRPAHKHGGKLGKKGIGKEHICVLCGASDSGDVFFDVACRGQLTKAAAKQVLGERICSGAIVSTDRQNHIALPSGRSMWHVTTFSMIPSTNSPISITITRSSRTSCTNSVEFPPNGSTSISPGTNGPSVSVRNSCRSS